MTAPVNPGGELRSVIAGMEDDVRRVEQMAQAFLLLGQCQTSSPDAVFVLGEHLEKIAEAIREQWDRAFDLAKDFRGVPQEG